MLIAVSEDLPEPSTRRSTVSENGSDRYGIISNSNSLLGVDLAGAFW
ncbi:MAG: hypothetical protein KME60_00160 [Cyanomargarita calcarea GSE-NOS-MK-12-04C]|jgi:hypothetical protein|uniref:Uncharacterized protein n=1 Tax=Cyanomargarita calcarea GSE-NOS-MK-12-04C TaxID=2839659 RepID=A0A951UQP6_9CYAN|nr:hypothetical protein [Cyanomargarita calcarea GSE-NOS-MK-12-04C]